MWLICPVAVVMYVCYDRYVRNEVIGYGYKICVQLGYSLISRR